jgi:hypothetical protein
MWRLFLSRNIETHRYRQVAEKQEQVLGAEGECDALRGKLSQLNLTLKDVDERRAEVWAGRFHRSRRGGGGRL